MSGVKMKASYKSVLVVCCCSIFLLGFACCKKNPKGSVDTRPIDTTAKPTKSEIDFYLTTGNQSSLLQKQNTILAFGTGGSIYPDITVDTTQTYQTVDGFGFTLTDASAG
ncbi:MAG TPA: hypothetical protein VL095_08670, partial [Flavisolibacter sp.]|nr:hypothetical protein [Flavisolibacter sp.]